MPAVPLHSRLLVLATVAILPLALMSGVALTALLKQQEAELEQTSIGMARALAGGIDAEIQLTVSALQTLALAEPLSANDDQRIAEAYALTKAARASRPEWRGVLLARSDGEIVFSSERPLGQAIASTIETSSLLEVVRTSKTTVGPLVQGPRGNYGFTIRAPVIRDGQVRYVLSAIVGAEAILHVIERQHIPDGWVASVFDSANRRVARSRDHTRFLGSSSGAALQAMAASMGDRREAVSKLPTSEGENAYTAVARVQSTPWIVALGASTSIAQAALWRSTWLYGGGLILSLLLGGMAAWRVSRSIIRPVTILRESAAALGAGKLVAPHVTGLREIDTVSVTLSEASASRAHIEAERERLFAAERGARQIAEAAQARLQTLAGASALLSRSLEEGSTLAAIASTIVPLIADVFRIDLLDGHGVLQRKLTHHADPARAAAIDRVVRSGVVSPETPGSFPWAVATGQTFLRNFEDQDFAEIADPVFREFARTVGMRAVFVAPLVARGRTIGVMAALQAESGRQFTAEDGALLGELAQRAALALDNVRLFSEYRSALERAEVASKTKDDFLAMLGHELRNPLAPIVAALELIRRRDPNVVLRERQIIERQVKHLSRLVDDLLDISRIVSGRIELAFETVDVGDVVKRSLELTQPAFEKRASGPTVISPVYPVHVRGDPLRLAQVLGNLLNNAAKFTPPEGSITVEWQRLGDQALLTVSDQGVGISEEFLPLVFERFVQGAQAFARSQGGLGLGLAIARSLTDLHGGSIRAESAGQGQGSRFIVEIPAVDLPAASAVSTPDSSASRQALASRLLVVDDNIDAANMLASLLQLDGHEVRTAESGEQALEVVKDFEPVAAILDLGLPGISGYDLAKALRANVRTRSILMIALTGYGQSKDREQALAAGFDEHMVKPVAVEALRARLAQYMAKVVAREST